MSRHPGTTWPVNQQACDPEAEKLIADRLQCGEHNCWLDSPNAQGALVAKIKLRAQSQLKFALSVWRGSTAEPLALQDMLGLCAKDSV